MTVRTLRGWRNRAHCGYCTLTSPDPDTGQRDLIENDACPIHGAAEEMCACGAGEHELCRCMERAA